MISVPVFGAIFMPVGLCIFLFRPRYLVALMLVSSVFAAASVLDFSVGDSLFGVQPYYFTALLLGIRGLPVLFKYRQLECGSAPGMRRIVGPLVGFWKWATVSAFIFPVIFKGLQVINPRSVDGDVMAAFAISGETSPLHLSLGNIGQVAYLTLSLVALLYVVASGRAGRGSGYSLGSLRVSIMIVSVVAVLQGVAAWRGWEFPYSFFSGNPAYSQAFAAQFEGVPRVSSTFTEASSAGGFLAAGALGLLAMRLRGGRAGLLEILLAVAGLILTTATTGYAAFLVGGLLLLICFAHGSLGKRLPQRVLRRGVYITLVVAGGVILLLTADPPLREAILASTVYKA